MVSASRVGVLKYGNNLVLMLESMDKWLLSKVLQDNFFEKEPVGGASVSQRADRR